MFYILLINPYSSCLPQKTLTVLLSPSRASYQITFNIPEVKKPITAVLETTTNVGVLLLSNHSTVGHDLLFVVAPAPHSQGWKDLPPPLFLPVLIPACSTSCQGSTIHTPNHMKEVKISFQVTRAEYKTLHLASDFQLQPVRELSTH